jgi:Protein of unknown function (DUF3309)
MGLLLLIVVILLLAGAIPRWPDFVSVNMVHYYRRY